MGGPRSNRKRGYDYYYTLNRKKPSLHSPDLDIRIDIHATKKPKTSSSAHLLTPERPVSSECVAARISRYPKPVKLIRREVHAPCRVSKVGFGGNSNRESRPSTVIGRKEGLSDEMGNHLSFSHYDRVKNGVIDTLRYLKNDKEVIDVDAETDNGDVSENPSVEEVCDLTNANLKGENTGRMFDSLSLNQDVDGSGLPMHKKLHETAERRIPNLSRLKFLIDFTENCLARWQLLRSVKKQEEDVLQEMLREPFVPLTEEEEAEVSRAFSNANRRKVLITHENSNIQITGQVLFCLKPHAWLNDEVINVYLELLKEREKREPKKFLKCHFFNTFFYKKLIGGRNGYDFKSVRRWTTQRKLGYCLIECDKIFVPIHKEIHWCLAVINKKDEKFQYLESLGGIDTQVLKVLARYLVDEAKDKGGKEIDVRSWKQEYVEDLPEQENGYDCGVFMIKYADFYSRGLGLCFNQEHMPYFRLRTAKEILRLKAG